MRVFYSTSFGGEDEYPNPDIRYVFSDIPHLHCLTKLDADNVSVYDVLEKGLNDLMDLCDVVMDKFTIARDEFTAQES